MAGDDLRTALWALLAEVDQLGAEFRDPDTPPERKQRIYNELASLYSNLTKIRNEHQHDQ